MANGNTGGGGGGITVETDPVFLKSPAASITEAKKTEWDNKVDKVDGKQLSTEDFTTTLKRKLDGLSNYDDTTISQAVEKLRTDLDALVSGDTTTAIKTFNEVIAFLDGISDTEDLSGIIASIEQQIAGKMDSVTLAKVATSGSYNDLANKPTIPAEQVNADWNATSGKAKILNKPTIPSAVTENTVSGWGFTKNTGTYSKPSTGIPKTDLANEVQNSLEKADYSVQYTINGEAVIEYGAIVDGQRGVFYALPSADDDAKANADYIIATEEYVDSKVSSGGGGSKVFVEVEPMKEPLGYFGQLGAIIPNNVYVFTKPIHTLAVSNFTESDSKGDEYSIMFTASKDNVSISLPSSPYKIYWANGVVPIISSGDLCELSLVRIGNDIKAVLTPFKTV